MLPDAYLLPERAADTPAVAGTGAAGGPVENTGSAAAIQLRDVAVRIGLQPILRSINLTVAHGQAVVLTGANGSGKTTLLRVLATLLRPSAGSVQLLGDSWTDAARPSRRRAIALVGHRSSLHPDLTLAENLELIARLAGVDPSRVPAVLDRVGLAYVALALVPNYLVRRGWRTCRCQGRTAIVAGVPGRGRSCS